MVDVEELVWVVLAVSSGRSQEVFVDLRLGGAKLWINYLRAAAWRRQCPAVSGTVWIYSVFLFLLCLLYTEKSN